jgi:hypothetical protein
MRDLGIPIEAGSGVGAAVDYYRTAVAEAVDQAA